MWIYLRPAICHVGHTVTRLSSREPDANVQTDRLLQIFRGQNHHHILTSKSRAVNPLISIMATATHLCFSIPISISPVLSRKAASFVTPNFQTTQSRIYCNVNPLGDFGARDPFPAEIESQFGEKVLGFSSTEHKILIPTASALSLAQQECTPISPSQTPLSEFEAKQLLLKVVGWKLANDNGVLKLQCTWKLRDFECGVELINRIGKVVEGTGHLPILHQLEQSNQVHAELWTPSIGGLSVNDFIVAAKIDQVKTSDLIPRKRVWA